jgi:hypothetical protein
MQMINHTRRQLTIERHVITRDGNGITLPSEMIVADVSCYHQKCLSLDNVIAFMSVFIFLE